MDVDVTVRLIYVRTSKNTQLILLEGYLVRPGACVQYSRWFFCFIVAPFLIYFQKNMDSQDEKWGKQHDARLKDLVRKGPSKGGITTKDTTRKYIREVLHKHFPDRLNIGKNPLDNFVRIFHNKIRTFKVGESYRGARSKLFLVYFLF